MNPDLCNKALKLVKNPNVLVNLISRRVRQLTSGGGGKNRPLIHTIENLGFADIALREIVEEKMGWELPETNVFKEETKPKRKKKS